MRWLSHGRCSPRRKALRALSGKAGMLRRREHGTPDHRPCPPALAEQPRVQSPAGIERKRALYGVPTKRQGCSWQHRVHRQPPLGLTGRMSRCLRARPHQGEGMSFAFVFPGQGSQVGGMGKALADAFGPARAGFEEVDAALGEKLTRIIWEGPAETLTLTENAQPALMAVSLAAMRVLETQAGVDLARDARFVAGHSLGEYSALAAAGALSVADSARLLRIRGRAMQKAGPVGAGAMAALLGLEFEVVQAVAAESAQGAVCEAANDNGAGQVVVSGDKAAVERAVELAKAKGAKRAMLLPVSAPFHCALMAPAADAMAEALAAVTIRPPAVPLVANVKAAAVTDPREIAR